MDVIRALGLLGSLAIAVFVSVVSQVSIGATIALAAFIFQAVLIYGRSRASATVINTPARGMMADIVRNGVFVIPLVLAIIAYSWLGIIGVIVAYLLSTITTSYSYGSS